MKTILKVLMIVGVAVTGINIAQADTQFVAADKKVSSEICVVATKGSKLKLLRAIKKSGVSRTYVNEHITCNGMPIVEFVEHYGENVAQVNRYLTGGKYTGQLLSQARVTMQ